MNFGTPNEGAKGGTLLLLLILLEDDLNMMIIVNLKKSLRWILAFMALALVSTALMRQVAAQDEQDQLDQDDPPSRVARLGYMEGAISFQPAGESECV